MNIDLLHRVADAIKTGWELCGSRWRKSEAEYIACECISSCRLNHENHGDAFSWYGTGLKKTSGGGLVNNPEGFQILIRVTDRLLEYAAVMCNIPVNSVDSDRMKVRGF